MAVSTAPLAAVGRPHLFWNQHAVYTLQQATAAVTSARSLDDVLINILNACSEGLGYVYPSFVLLEVQGEKLIGRVVSSPQTWESARRAAQIVGVQLGRFGSSVMKRGSSPELIACTANVPLATITFRLDTTDNLLIQVFQKGVPHVAARLYDLVRPHLQVRVAAAFQHALGIDSIALLPLVAAERCVGVLVVATPSAQPFTPMDMPALELFAAQAAMAIENARLQQDLRDREQQVSLLLKATIDAQEEERERICLEIHDGVAQTMTAAFHYLQTLDSRPGFPDDLRVSIRKAGALMRTAIREAREVIASLRPAALDALGLVATLRYEMEELKAQTGWRVDFAADPMRFPKTVETALYRIVHEAVNNVTKHAQARRVSVRVKQEQGHIIAEVEDDGVGFDLPTLERQFRRNGVGLLSMRKRAELLQGSFQVVSFPGKGTRVRVEVPLFAGKEQQKVPSACASHEYGYSLRSSNALSTRSPDRALGIL